MKKLLVVLFVLLNYVLEAQESYYSVEVNGYIGDAGSCGTEKGLRHITLMYSDGTIESLFNGPNFERRPIKYSTKIRDNRKIQTLFIKSKRQSGDLWGCNNNDDTNKTEIINRKTCFYLRNDDAFGPTDGWYDFRIAPVISLQDPGVNAFIGSEDPINLGVQTTNLDLNYFNWKYRVQGSTIWKNLPAKFQKDNYISIKGDDFLSASDYGKDISFRIHTGCESNNSNFVTYKALRSAPKIISNTSKQVTCFGGKDGAITLKFDRNLRPGENISFKVSEVSNANPPVYLPISTPGTNNITDLGLNKEFNITGLPASKNKFIVEMLGSNLFTDGTNHKLEFTINQPAYVEFKTPTFTNVNCFSGSDGTISLEAKGGTEGNYQYQLENPDGTIAPWQAFSNTFTHTITALPIGTYKIKIRDGNECKANEVSDIDLDGNLDIGDEIVHTVTITKPNAPLELNFDDSKDATAAGFTDGFIRVLVFGGTPNPDGSYNVSWKNAAGTTLTTVDTQVVPEGYLVTLRDIGVGSYFVSVTDANHTAATQKETCEILATEFSIAEPPPLVATLEETNSISCNSTNAFNDPFSDGELVAHASGGVPLGLFDNGGLPYYYTWKKEDASGVFQELLTETDSILGNISVGRYSVNVKDANDIILAEYVNNVLVNPEDIVYDLKEPDLITITFDKGSIACNAGNEGWAQANISGGTGAYTLRWSNGATTDLIENLVKGTYLLFVTDEKGCEATGQVLIEAPDALSVAITQQKNPTCNNGTDGEITLAVTGGVAPYTYQWLKDNEPTSILGAEVTNRTAGTYTVTITDANWCSETLEIVLENPKPNLIDLGEDRTLCGGQSVLLDATYEGAGTSYQWRSDTGFTSTSPIIEVSEAGTYSVAITTVLGCTGGDTIAVSVSDTPIDAHFVLSTQAFVGQEVAIVNLSDPLGDKVEWFFPPEATIIAKDDESVILLFNNPGAYEIILRSHQGNCYLDYMKTIIIDEAEHILDIGDAETPFIKEFKAFPNPSNGNFKVAITLSEASEISLKMFSLASHGLVNKRKENAASDFELDYSVVLASGSYILLLETAKGSEIRKVNIQ